MPFTEASYHIFMYNMKLILTFCDISIAHEQWAMSTSWKWKRVSIRLSISWENDLISEGLIYSFLQILSPISAISVFEDLVVGVKGLDREKDWLQKWKTNLPKIITSILGYDTNDDQSINHFLVVVVDENKSFGPIKKIVEIWTLVIDLLHQPYPINWQMIRIRSRKQKAGSRMHKKKSWTFDRSPDQLLSPIIDRARQHRSTSTNIE